MKDVLIPPSALFFEASLTCTNCASTFTAEAADLQYDGFKKPGTYWFDGSADGSVEYRFFVSCPTCNHLSFISPCDVPVLVAKDLKSARAA